MLFYEKIENQSLRQLLKNSIRDIWIHTSTAIEGNTLTLEETTWVLNEGTAIGGKDIYDQVEVVNYSKAIDLLYTICQKSVFTQQDIFDLHQTYYPSTPRDVGRPVAAWKTEENFISKTENGKAVFIPTTSPKDTPELMSQLVDSISEMKPGTDQAVLAQQYAFIHNITVKIHPLCDGNGRMARLIANIPILKSGYPPIVILKEHRQKYMQLLQSIELVDRTLTLSGKTDEFVEFLRMEWNNTFRLLNDAKKLIVK